MEKKREKEREDERGKEKEREEKNKEREEKEMERETGKETEQELSSQVAGDAGGNGVAVDFSGGADDLGDLAQQDGDAANANVREGVKADPFGVEQLDWNKIRPSSEEAPGAPPPDITISRSRPVPDIIFITLPTAVLLAMVLVFLYKGCTRIRLGAGRAG